MNNYREEMLSNFNWKTKQSHRIGTSPCEVTITMTKDKRLNITFRNNSYEKIAQDGKYITFCFHKNRVFFKESDPRNGYKISSNQSERNRYVQATITDEAEKAFIGDYEEIKYDDFLELYYIEKKVKG